MALIKCPECGKEISDQSEVCVHCGFPFKQHYQNKLDEQNGVILKRTSVSFAVYIFIHLMLTVVFDIGIALLIVFMLPFSPLFGLAILLICLLILFWCISIAAMVEGIVMVCKNNRRLETNMIEYDENKNTLICHTLNNKKIIIPIKKFVALDGNRSMYIYYRNNKKRVKNAFLGFSDRECARKARSTIVSILNKV